VNSTSSSRLWKWSGRLYADDTLQTASTNDDTVTKTSQHGGIYSYAVAIMIKGKGKRGPYSRRSIGGVLIFLS